MNNFNIGVLTPLTLAFVEIVKELGLPKKWSPVLAIIVGVGFSFMVGTGSWQETAITGIIIGLSACGIYSGVKNTKEALVGKRVDTKS